MENKMSNWDSFEREEKERESAVVGKHRVVIVDAEEGKTGANSKKPGTPMIIVKLRPSGRKFTVTYRVVKNEYFNRNMTQFFDAFPEITFGDFNFLSWVGAEGAAMFKEDAQGYTQISYFLDPVRAADLPAFEGEKPEKQSITTLEDDDGELPF
jgi:hypothetical protein